MMITVMNPSNVSIFPMNMYPLTVLYCTVLTDLLRKIKIEKSTGLALQFFLSISPN